MSVETRPSRRSPADYLLSWDRLGFRVLVFGGLASLWVLQGGLAGQPWSDVIRGEMGGMMPWPFLAPIVLWLGDRIRIERLGLGRYLAGHLLGMVLVFVPYWVILRTIGVIWSGFVLGWEPARLRGFVPTRENLLGGFLSVPFVYFLILLGVEAMNHARARREEEVQAGRLAGQLAEARLALLQRQLQPHFLFNALQAISTLLHRDPAAADGLLVRLSTLLRAMLENASGQTLPLRTELELTRKYLEIEQVRFGDRLRVEWKVDGSVLDVPVPSLIVLPLVENAIRHGLSPRVGPGLPRLSARPEGEWLAMTVEDDGLGATLPLRSGVGLGNTRERIEAMYGGRATLRIEAPPGGGFRVDVRIPLPEAGS